MNAIARDLWSRERLGVCRKWIRPLKKLDSDRPYGRSWPWIFEPNIQLNLLESRCPRKMKGHYTRCETSRRLSTVDPWLKYYYRGVCSQSWRLPIDSLLVLTGDLQWELSVFGYHENKRDRGGDSPFVASSIGTGPPGTGLRHEQKTNWFLIIFRRYCEDPKDFWQDFDERQILMQKFGQGRPHQTIYSSRTSNSGRQPFLPPYKPFCLRAPSPLPAAFHSLDHESFGMDAQEIEQPNSRLWSIERMHRKAGKWTAHRQLLAEKSRSNSLLLCLPLPEDICNILLDHFDASSGLSCIVQMLLATEYHSNA